MSEVAETKEPELDSGSLAENIKNEIMKRIENQPLNIVQQDSSDLCVVCMHDIVGILFHKNGKQYKICIRCIKEGESEMIERIVEGLDQHGKEEGT
jgi:hypothetical protein